MRLAMLLGGALLVATGGIWALQGAGVLVSASPMTDVTLWVWVGGATALAGLVLLVTGARRTPGPRR